MPDTARTRCPSAANRQLARHTAAYTAGLEFHDLFHHNRDSVPRCPACGDILGHFVGGHPDQPGYQYRRDRRYCSAAGGAAERQGVSLRRLSVCRPAVSSQAYSRICRLVANRPPLGSTGCGTRPGRSIRQARSRLRSSQLRRALVEIEALGLWHRSKRGTWTPTYFPSAGGISQARS